MVSFHDLSRRPMLDTNCSTRDRIVRKKTNNLQSLTNIKNTIEPVMARCSRWFRGNHGRGLFRTEPCKDARGGGQKLGALA